MIGHVKLTFCPKAKKYTYSSEAKALKFVESRSDLQRAYYCPHCDGYHVTSQKLEDTIRFGGMDDEELENLEQPEEITLDLVAERLKQLKNKL